MKQTEIKEIQIKLQNWYEENKRELPWRNTKDPYKIWISEIILQQTRVKQGYQYYLNFLEKFPTIQSLANSDEQEVLKQWQGLGYYTRARNLHKTAKIITDKFNGTFPNRYTDILSLAGIGEYTASAISSFAFKLPHAVLDGNVYRFLSRLFADETPIQTSAGKKVFNKYASLLLDKKNPDTHNQAIMEIGALQCTPTSPNCPECPIDTHCKAFEVGKVEEFPVKTKKIKQRKRYFNYLFILDNEKTFIQKRTRKDIWQNLYELPLIESNKSLTWNEITKTDDFLNYFSENTNISAEKPTEINHILSHQKIMARFFVVYSQGQKPKNTIEVSINKLENYPISRLIDIFLKENIKDYYKLFVKV